LKALSRLGLKVARRSPANDDMISLGMMLKARNVDLILDVGANVGQFADKMFDIGYEGRLVSYEPLSRPHEILVEKAQQVPHWDVVKMCIGDTPGEVVLKISHNEIASSALEFTGELSEYQPEFEYVGSETVEVQTLDQAASYFLETAEHPFLKIDVQGFEEQVMAGGKHTLERCVGLQIELSLMELNSGQMLFSEMLRVLEDLGFTVYRMFPAWIDVRDGRWLQADVILFRN
jgi:FkbM family methyltransferase